ncbi:hypothetical protein HY772_06725 [Candidatus Woesearchaeota archaeon]|nr:hypothetical protein [Candidatus Woesearchaeota archaeon]
MQQTKRPPVRRTRRRTRRRSRLCSSYPLTGAIVTSLLAAIFAAVLFITFVLTQLPDLGGVCGLDMPQFPCTIELVLTQSFLYSALVFLLLFPPAFFIGLLAGLLTRMLR